MMKSLKAATSTGQAESREGKDSSYPPCQSNGAAGQITSSFYQLIQSEVYHGDDCLTAEMNQHLKEYYPNLLKHPRLVRFYEYNWVKRMMNIIPFIRNSSSPLSILDAGCGVGSESIFFSSLNQNLKVVGVDCQTPYTPLAKARIPYYERILNRPLNIRFVHDDIMDFVPAEPLDIIWVMEAISHIYPPDLFIKRMYQYLKKGGLIFISDSNLLNPYMYYRILRLRGFRKPELVESPPAPTGIRRTGKDEQTSKPLRVFSENLFSIFEMERILRENKFKILSRQVHGFLPPKMFSLFNDSGKLDTLFAQLPAMNWFGGIYTIIARK